MFISTKRLFLIFFLLVAVFLTIIFALELARSSSPRPASISYGWSNDQPEPYLILSSEAGVAYDRDWRRTAMKARQIIADCRKDPVFDCMAELAGVELLFKRSWLGVPKQEVLELNARLSQLYGFEMELPEDWN